MTGTAVAGEAQLRVGRYLVEARLGEGGMACTWLCRLQGSQGFSKNYVVKTLKPTCRAPQFFTMFADEARIGAKLDHPNIPKIVEFGEAGGLPYLVQEFVDGPTLLQILARQASRRRFDVALGCQVVAEIAGALHSAFNTTDETGRRLNVVHRDVSPSNILVSRQGVAKLIDFGVARFDARETQTDVGYVKGKLRYMAPEVLRDCSVSHQSDLYSLGVCLYALCTGESLQGPAEGGSVETLEQMLARHAVDPELAIVLQRCLAPLPEMRYPSGQRMKEALETWLDAHGGRLAPEQVAARLAELFPGGPLEWRVDEPTVASMRSELASVDAYAQARRLWALPLAVALLLLTLGLLGGSSIAALWFWSAPPPATAPESQAAVLDNIERQIALGRLEEASFIASSLVPTAPDEVARLAALLGKLTEARAARIRDRAVNDPAGALLAARALLAERPGDPVVEALLVSLSPSEAVPAAPVEVPVEVPRPKLRPVERVKEEELLQAR